MDDRKKFFWRELEDTPTDEASQSDGESSAKQYEMSLNKARIAGQKNDPGRNYNFVLDSHLSDSISQRNMEFMMNIRNPEPRNVMPVHSASTSNVRKSEMAMDSDSAGRSRNRYPALNNKSKKHVNNNNNNSREKRPDDIINDDFQERPIMIRNHWDQDRNESASDSRGNTDTSGWYYEGGTAEDQERIYSQWMRSPDGKIHLRNYKLKEQWDEHMWKPKSSANKERFYGNEQERRTFTDEQDDTEGNEPHFCQGPQKDDTLIRRERGINKPYNRNVIDVPHFSDEGESTSESEDDFSAEFDKYSGKNNLSSRNRVNRENFQHGRCNSNEDKTRRHQSNDSFGMEHLDFNQTEDRHDVHRRSFHLEQAEAVNNRIDFSGMDTESKHQNRRKKSPEVMMEDIDISAKKKHETGRYGTALFRNLQSNRDCSIPTIGCSADMHKYREHLINNGRIEDGESTPEDFFLKINAKAEEKKRLQQQKFRHNAGHQKIENCEKNYQSDNLDYDIWNHKNDLIFDNQRCDIHQSNCESCGNNKVDCLCRKYDIGNDDLKDDSPSSDLSDRFGDLSEESDDDGEEYEAFSGSGKVHTSQPNSQNYLGRTGEGQRLAKNLRKPKKKSRDISRNLGRKTSETIQDYSPQQEYHIHYGNTVPNSVTSDLVKQRQNKFPKTSRSAWEDASEMKEVREHFGNRPQENIQQTSNSDNLEYSTRSPVRESNTKARQCKPIIRKNEEKSRNYLPVKANRINGWTGIRVKHPEAEYQNSEAYHHNQDKENPYNDNSKFVSDTLVGLKDNVSYPNERFVYEAKEGKSVEGRTQYNGRTRSSVPRNPRKIVGRQRPMYYSHNKNFSASSELRGEQILVLKNKDFNNPYEDKTDVTDLFEKQEKLIDFGQQISHSLTSSHLSKQLFLPMYHEWLTIRERTISLLQKIFENIQESEGWHETFIRNWNAEIQSMRTTSAETPTKNENGAWKSFLKIFSNNPNPPPRTTVTFEISVQDARRILEEDVNLSGEIQMFGLQCVTQFKETNRLMKNFRDTVIKDQLFENLQCEHFQGFLMAIAKADPDDTSFCEEVSKAYKKLIDSIDEDYIPVAAHDAFCKSLKEDATILKTMKSVNWNPRKGFDGLTNEGSEIITHFEKDLGSWSKTYTVQHVVETLTVLIAEKNIFASDAAFLL